MIKNINVSSNSKKKKIVVFRYLPGDGEASVAEELVTRFLGDQVDQLDRFTKDQVVLEKEELQKCLKTISTIIIGKCSFWIMFGRTGEFNVLV